MVEKQRLTEANDVVEYLITAKLDFCCSCGCWISANTGEMRQGPDGEVEIICPECLAIEQGRAVLVGPDVRCGMLGND